MLEARFPHWRCEDQFDIAPVYFGGPLFRLTFSRFERPLCQLSLQVPQSATGPILSDERCSANGGFQETENLR